MKQLWMCAVSLFISASSANTPQDKATESLLVPLAVAFGQIVPVYARTQHPIYGIHEEAVV